MIIKRNLIINLLHTAMSSVIDKDDKNKYRTVVVRANLHIPTNRKSYEVKLFFILLLKLLITKEVTDLCFHCDMLVVCERLFQNERFNFLISRNNSDTFFCLMVKFIISLSFKYL